MPHIYDLLVLGNPSSAQAEALEQAVSAIVGQLGLRFGDEVGWQVCPKAFEPGIKATAIAYFADGKEADPRLAHFMAAGIPILPVVSSLKNASQEMPAILQSLNALPYQESGVERVATALLECASLLPSQRKVFLSYRRDEARDAALQLFDALSARLFDVFLDTHKIAPAEDFQARLWHQLCDADVVVMLDTPQYFASRWTRAEFGKALAKDIAILRVGWPDVKASPRAALTESLTLGDDDMANAGLSEHAIAEICTKVESLRSKTYAVRSRNLLSSLQQSLQKLGGDIFGAGLDNGIYLRLPDDRKMVVYPSTGVPTSMTLHRAVSNAAKCDAESSAVIYDHVGLHQDWVKHMEWLADNVKSTTRWLKANEAAWQLADWQVSP